MRSARSLIKFAFVWLWLFALLAVLALWLADYSNPRVGTHLSNARDSLVIGESYDGQLMLLYVHLDNGRITDPGVSLDPVGHRGAVFSWTVPGDPYLRSATGVGLIDWADHYGSQGPLFCDGTSFESGIDHFFLKFVRGPATLNSNGTLRDPMTWFHLIVPNWLLLALFGGIPAVFMVRPAVRRLIAWRRPAGRCRACGYDLRMTPDRCPECGAVPKRATAAPATAMGTADVPR